MSLSTHTLVSASLLRVSYSLSVAISTAIALTAMWLVLRLVFQLMAQSTFDERLVHLSDRCDNVIACMQQSRRVSLSYSTHMPIAIILLSHFIATVKRLTVFVECYQRIEDVCSIWHRHGAHHSRNVHIHARRVTQEMREASFLSDVSHIAQSPVTRHSEKRSKGFSRMTCHAGLCNV